MVVFVDTREEAQALLTADGLAYHFSSPFMDREYWYFSDRKNTHLDHSATITASSNGFAISKYYEVEHNG
jgi:hypothetical protein